MRWNVDIYSFVVLHHNSKDIVQEKEELTANAHLPGENTGFEMFTSLGLPFA